MKKDVLMSKISEVESSRRGKTDSSSDSDDLMKEPS